MRGATKATTTAMTRAATAFAVLVTITACSSRSTPRPTDDGVPWATSGVDWARPPAPLAVPRWQPPTISEVTLPSSVRVLVIENHRQPLVAVSVINTGAGGVADAPGLASLTADAACVGTSVEAVVAADYASHQLVVQTAQLDGAIRELGHVLRTPKLGDADIVRLRDARLRVVTAHRDSSRTVAAQVFDRVVFGPHAYGAPAEGMPETVGAITPEQVRAFYKRAYQPSSTTVVIAGDVTAESVKPLLDATFGDWKTTTPAAPSAPALPAYAPQLAYVDKPGATEVVVIVGGRAAAAPGPIAADLANALLGGGTDGTLDRVLHGEKAYTYGVSSSFWRGAQTGSWAVTATFRNEVAADALRTTLSLVEAARTQAPTAAALAEARADYQRAVARSFETVAGSARALQRLVVQRRPATWFATLDAQLAAVTPADLPTAVADAWKDLSVVVVGDWTKVGDALRSAGLPVVAYRADGTRTP